MNGFDLFSITVLAILIVLSCLTLIGIGSLAVDSVRLFRRWRAMR
jgi:hypothetical protein